MIGGAMGMAKGSNEVLGRIEKTRTTAAEEEGEKEQLVHGRRSSRSRRRVEECACLREGRRE